MTQAAEDVEDDVRIADVSWPDVEDVDDMPIAAQFARDLRTLMAQADDAMERIDTLYRTGIREIRELLRGQ